jgi:pectin methylesterase-like acyl-CoA thioesterase
MRKTILIIVFISIFFVNKSWGKIIIIAPSGGNYTSVQAGVSAANGGDTVLVKTGKYNEAVSITKSGSDNKYIALLGEPGAVIDGTGKSGEAGITISSKNYIKVIGLEIQNFSGSGNSTPMGISVNGSSSDLVIRNNKIHDINNDNGNAHGGYLGLWMPPVSVYGCHFKRPCNVSKKFIS